ncbi:energy-coupling factor transporter transmembrane component T family protein [Cellulomonas sp. SG140]|uniref:energy-coupling factor transporter transmembrane component T family protein n=1 Tax=Cellulomonas sp. SG140 TaxID=2976536 RepID=UPI0021E979F7|nr:energy-coupling factor transporter transmembrane protein EcfT [Cellulomonas sp. SG140]
MRRGRRDGWTGPLGLYVPGTSPLHRLPVWASLLGTAVFTAAVVLVPGVPAAVTGVLVACGAAAVAQLPWRRLVLGLRPGLVAAAFVGLGRWWTGGAAAGVAGALDLLAVVLAGVVLAATTPADELVSTVAGATTHLKRFGVRPGSVGLGVAVMLRSVPVLVTVLGESADAARARGLDRSPRALVVPAGVRTVAHARRVGEALAARGLPDD